MRRKAQPKGPIWPSWRYGPDGKSGVFESELDVPDGWGLKPGEFPPPKEDKPTIFLDRAELVIELQQRNIDIDPTWGVAHMKRIIDGDSSTAR